MVILAMKSIQMDLTTKNFCKLYKEFLEKFPSSSIGAIMSTIKPVNGSSIIINLMNFLKRRQLVYKLAPYFLECMIPTQLLCPIFMIVTPLLSALVLISVFKKF